MELNVAATDLRRKAPEHGQSMIDLRVRILWVFGAISAPLFLLGVLWATHIEPEDKGEMGAALVFSAVTLLGAFCGYWALCVLVYRWLKAGDQQDLRSEKKSVHR